jgi:6,7-dimethyl-8-ribityllumazine synthase
MKELEIKKVDGRGLKVLIVHTRWNSKIVNALVEGCVETLVTNGVSKDKITIQDVPGAFELPFATQSLMSRGDLEHFDVCIPIGVLIKGSTSHFEYICEAVSHGLMEVQLKLYRPVMFGVLTCLTEEQALERAGMGGHNHGIDWALGAIEMALLNK